MITVSIFPDFHDFRILFNYTFDETSVGKVEKNISLKNDLRMIENFRMSGKDIVDANCAPGQDIWIIK